MIEEWEQKPLEPARHPQDERLKQERDVWRKKYEQIFEEQIAMRKIENQLRRDLESSLHAHAELKKENIKITAELEGIKRVNDRILDSILERVNKE